MLKSWGWWVGWVGGVGGVVAHKILVSAPVPLELILTGFDWVGAGPWGFGDLGRGLTILNSDGDFYSPRDKTISEVTASR